MISGFPLFASAITLVLGALIVGSEFNWETFKTVLVQRPGRKSVLSGKFLTLAIAVFVFVLTVFVAGAASSGIVAMIESAPMNWPSIGDLLLAVGVGWFILVVWAVFGAMLATLSQGTSLAIGLGLVYLLAVEGLIAFAAQSSELIAALWRILPRANAGSIAAALVPSGISAPGVEAAVGPTQATLVVAIYLSGYVLVTGVVFLRRDVT
jgi:ABC-2 type transport system permease protein